MANDWGDQPTTVAAQPTANDWGDTAAAQTPAAQPASALSRFAHGVWEQTGGAVLPSLKQAFGVDELSNVHDLFQQGKRGEALTKLAEWAGKGPAGHIAEGIVNTSVDQAKRAVASAKEGQYSEATAHAGATVLPMLAGTANAPEKIRKGDVAGGLGDVAGNLGTMLVPEIAERAGGSVPIVPKMASELTPEAASAVRYADENSIPISAGTRTGNKFVKNVQTLAQNQPIASTVASRAIGDTRAALISTATKLGEEAVRPPGTPPALPGAPAIVPTAESAGAGVSSTLSDLSQQHGAAASKAYGRLEKIEALPEHSQTIQVGTKNPDIGPLDDLAKSLSGKSYAQLDSVHKAMVDGVAERSGIRTAPEPITKDIALPVDMRGAKASLKPVLDRLEQEMPLAQQQSSRGLLALRNVVSGDDYLPASVADQNLSALKQLQREAVHPKTKYLATRAVDAVAPAVDTAVAKAGPAAVEALNDGRALTKAKFATDATIEQLPTEPVRLFDKLTSQRDTAINLMRDVASKAPDAIPAVGRAYLEGLFENATSAEGKPGAGTAFSNWNKLGDATKKTLFPNPLLRRNLDDFFTLAKAVGENPNPSGTAHVASSLITLSEGGLMLHNPVAGVASILAWPAVTKLLYSTRGSKLLQTGLRVKLTSAAAPVVAGFLVRGVGQAKVPLAASDQSEPTEQVAAK